MFSDPPNCRRTQGVETKPSRILLGALIRGRFMSAVAGLFLVSTASNAATLWSDPGDALICNSGPGRDILNGTLKRDDSSRDTLYFKFRVSPLSDNTTEEYFAACELYEGDVERLGLGNALKAYAYSAFFRADPAEGNEAAKYLDLRSARPERNQSGTALSYELPRRDVTRCIVFKVQYVPGGEDLVTVWLDPDLSAGATEVQQPEALTTRFNANASFDELRLRHEGKGEGWLFSDLAIASSFGDFVEPGSAMFRTSPSSPFFSRQRLHFETWFREPNMPRAPIRALAQTSDGYLWLAGDDRLARFDGVRFVALNGWPAVGTSKISRLLGDRHGALWIGTTDAGCTRYSGGEFKTFDITHGLPANSVTAMAGDLDGVVWLGTPSGLATWRGNQWVAPDGLDQLKGKSIAALHADAGGALWIGVNGDGVYRLYLGQLSLVSDAGVAGSLRHPRALTTDADGRLWVVSADNLALCQQGDEWRRYRLPAQGESPASSIAVELDGTVWVATERVLVQIRQGQITAPDSAVDYSEGESASLLVDHDGNLWAGGGSGLHLLRRRTIFPLGQSEGISAGALRSLAEVAPGVIWAMQSGRGLFRWEGNAFRGFVAAGLDARDPAVGPMLVDTSGQCWISCGRGLLLYRDPQAVLDENLMFPLNGVTITALAEGDDGSIRAGTLEGQLWHLSQGAWSRNPSVVLPSAVTTLARGPGGVLALGTLTNGVYLLDSTNLMRLGSGSAGNPILSLHYDGNGVLWAGTAGSGLLRYANQTVMQFTDEQGLPDNNIQFLLEDEAGHLWMADGSGTSCIEKPASADARVRILSASPLSATAAPGSSASDASPMSRRGCVTSMGQLWFATSRGAVVVEPPRFQGRSAPPRLILEDILVDGVGAGGFRPMVAVPEAGGSEAAPQHSLSLPPGKHSLEIHYASPSFHESDQVKFRYKLEGLDANWVEAESSWVAQYRYMPPGKYTFQLAAAGAKGDSTRLALDLTVTPHLWQRSWVIGSAALGLMFAIAGGARFVENRRMKRRMLRLEQEHALERERSRIAQDLHDEMGAKLCRISFLSEHVNRLHAGSPEIKPQVAAIADDSRQLLNSLDEMVWVVNPQNDTLEHAASYIGQYAINYFQGTGVECEADIASGIPHLPVSSQVRHHLFLAVHEALTNALKHSGATRVRLVISWMPPEFLIRVEDDGRGFEMDSGAKRQGADGQSHDGLTNMRHRMSAIGGQCIIKPASDRGTCVEFVLGIKSPDEEEAAS